MEEFIHSEFDHEVELQCIDQAKRRESLVQEFAMEFDSWQSYNRFEHSVRRVFRHVRDDEDERFVKSVIETARKRVTLISKQTPFWRSQLGNDLQEHPIFDENLEVVDSYNEEVAYKTERMKPQLDRAKEGRVNPKGIPCLYLSDDVDTAMGEMRPWIGSFVCLAQFLTVRDLLLVDCSLDARNPTEWFYFNEPSADEKEKCVWSDINRAFSTPVTDTDNIADYAPTQVLAESFKLSGFNGLIYSSKVGKGKSIALFNVCVRPTAVLRDQASPVTLIYRASKPTG